MATFVTHNAPEVLKSSKATRQQVTQAAYYANRKTADMAVEYTRRHIAPTTSGLSRFPGYAAKGALQRAVQARGPMPIAGGVKSDVFMASDGTRKYQRIHEFGGIIRARNGGWLRFPKPPAGAPRSPKIPGNRAFEKGGYVFALAVRIMPKRYWSRGWEYGKQRFNADFNRFFVSRLPR
jgi:hypothetical protein